MWLLDAALREKKLQIRIQETDGLPGWCSGRYEGRVGTLDDSTLNGESFEAICQMKDRFRTKLKVPIEYIKPLRPTGVGERVVVIGGDKVGTHAIVHSNTDGRWVLKALDGSTIITYIEDKEQLCLSAS